MQFGLVYVAAGAILAVLAALAVYHFAVVRPALRRNRYVLELHDNLLSGGSGGAAERLGALEDGRERLAVEARRLSERIAALEALAVTDLSRAGFVRYDAFAGSGAGLSYALALLNRQGDGVVLTSIYSRDDTRTFGKPVAGFKPTVQASTEELEAIERARSNGS
jgi:Protein of unknown function (DUF4446)